MAHTRHALNAPSDSDADRNFEAKLISVLDQRQTTRLAELSFQYRMLREPLAFLSQDKQLAEELSLDAKQCSKLKALNDSAGILFWNQGEKEVALVEKALSYLNKEQRAKLKSLHGKPFNIVPCERLFMNTARGRFTLVLESSDKNGDKVITRKEAPDEFTDSSNKHIDENSDGRWDKQEIAREFKRIEEKDSKYRRSIRRLISQS